MALLLHHKHWRDRLANGLETKSKFIFLYVCNYRNEAIHVVAENVLVPRGLLGIGRDKLDHSGAEIAEALTLYTSTQTTPVLVHCTQGKDRTGILGFSALVKKKS